MKYLIIALLILLSSCNGEKKNFVIEENDTIASYIRFKYEYGHKNFFIVKDSLNENKLHSLASRLDIPSSLNSDEFENCFVFVSKGSFTDTSLYDDDNYYLIYHLWSDDYREHTEYDGYFKTKEEEEQSQKKINEITQKAIDKSNKEMEEHEYYKQYMKYVTKYCEEHFDDYTSYSSSDMKKQGNYYTVRHIFKAKNALGNKVKFDKIFKIDKNGNMIDYYDYIK